MLGMALWWLAVILLVLALVFYIIGAKGIAGITMGIARWMLIFFIIAAVISIIIALF